MALDGKIKKTNTPPITPANNNSTKVAEGNLNAKNVSKVIPIAENNMELNPVIEYIKTEEFSSLLPEQQLIALKSKFPNISEQELKLLLDTAKTIIETQNQPLAAEEDASTDIPKSEEEQLIEDVAQEIKDQGKKEQPTIDDVISYISSIPEKDRTEAQIKVLNFVNNFSKDGTISISKQEFAKLVYENKEALENLIPKDVLESEQWKNKTPMEKLDARADVILSKIVPGFDKLQNEEIKNKYRQSFYNQIGSVTNEDWNNFDDAQKEFEIQNIALMIDATEFSEYSIKDLIKISDDGQVTMDKEVAQKISNNYITDKVFEKFTSSNIDVCSEEWIQSGSKAQLAKITDTILTDMDRNYATLPESEKSKKRDLWINNFAKQIYSDWETLSPREKENRKRLFASELSAIKHYGASPSEYYSSDGAEKSVILQQYYSDAHIELNSYQICQHETIARLGNKSTGKIGTSVTEKDMLETLDLKIKKGSNLTPEEQELYKFLQTKQEHYNADAKCKNIEEYQDYIVKTQFNGDVKKYVNEVILNGKSKEEIIKDEKYLKQVLSEFHSPRLAKAVCHELGLDPSKYLNENQNIDRAVEGMIKGDVNEINEANKGFHHLGLENRVNQTTIAVPKEIKEHEKRLDYAVATAALDVKYTQAIATSWNDTKYVSTSEAKALGRDFNTSDYVSDASKSTFTKSFIETAKNDSIRLEYAKEFLTIDNASVTEGVAAASHSVSDPNVRAEYNASVETAAKNYPPEQQANINYALETGNISESTMAKTTPPAAYASDDTTGYNASTSNYSNSTSSYNKTTASDKTVTQAAASAHSTAPTYSANNTVQPDIISKTVAASEAKRQAAMDNAISTAKSINEAVEKWNNEHPKKLSIEDVDAIKAQAAVETAQEVVDSADIPETEKERIIKALSDASSIGEIYDILVSALGSSRVQDRFIEILASTGSSSDIKAFISSRAGSTDTFVKQLFLRTTSSSLKKELLNMLSSDTIAELLANGHIKDLSSVDQRILIRYVMKNLYLMSNTEFARFLKAIVDPNEKEKLIALHSGARQLNDNKPVEIVETSATGEAPTVTTVQAFEASNQKPEPYANKLGSEEFSTDLEDRTKLTKEGAGFGAVNEDLAGIVENPKPKDGSPIGMNDRTLTVNSNAWKRRYNKDNEPTAFTMAAMEEEEYDGLSGFPPPTLAAWKFRGKKRNNGLNFRV